ncbi:uncharacterized protein PHACADRAFT_205965 [Phanerochaete carnosa HHB-10118-sp]|uniref:MutL C-terminal dimerisation domain-containing protein n=1 Tax=Phanerochaete carnosa (strain HHB-10118-sp) TaxID=650164 RepID=K5WKQ2_PHACS|nr:uncharacterized protein PHACADRAFT_205965 [Phanerochaete carnosa HHB-10118-sp]EKM59744.1 hypothetical protein PHACADRAFT_205965 [Phanerochaete carnosa HHB-10118-sp]
MAAATPNELQCLPTSTQNKIRSTQIVVSLPQLVLELVQNALDAGAGQVDVGVDCEEWACWVKDNGKGMSKQDLSSLETAGRYGTSKAYTMESLGEISTFGFRGEALASIADLSCLEVTSRTAMSRESWSTIWKGSKHLYSGPAIRWRQESQGTVACVRDAFYNLPIRRLSHISPSRTLELIRKDLEALALVFPHVTFSLENTHKSNAGRSDVGRIAKIPKTSSMLHAFRHLFGRALVEHIEDIHDTHEDISIDGFISLNGVASKACTSIFASVFIIFNINRHLLSTCDLHRIIDSAFAASSFGKHALDEYNQLSQAETIRRPPNMSEKKPVYVLNVTVSPRYVDNCVELGKTAVNLQNNRTVSGFLLAIIQAFLVKHNFKTQGIPQSKPSPRKRRKLTCDTEPKELCERISLQDRAELPVIVPKLDDTDDDDVLWTDPSSGVVYNLDRRTGNSYLIDASRQHTANAEGGPQSRRTLQHWPTNQTSTTGIHDMPSWIKEALGANQTFVLKLPSIPSLSLSSSFVGDQERCQYLHGRQSFLSQADAISNTQSQLARFSRNDLSRTCILGQVDRKFVACVIPSNTVAEHEARDSSLKTEDEGLLVLLDQHAADERIRVERFMRELCKGFSADGQASTLSPDVRKLDPPARIVLTRREADILASTNVQAAFRLWGVGFGPAPEVQQEEECISRFFSTAKAVGPVEHSGYVQVDVLTVPEVVARKLLADDHLRDLVKSYLADLDGSGLATSLLSFRPVSADPSTVWQRAMQWCPQELQELVNSKACRGAIMFNDPLSSERCEQLVSELCETALPFQCAHGRPSLVPLTSIQGPLVQGVEMSRHLVPIQWAIFGKEH